MTCLTLPPSIRSARARARARAVHARARARVRAAGVAGVARRLFEPPAARARLGNINPRVLFP